MKQVDTKPINRTAIVSDIVISDYRTADIFRKYSIELGETRTLEMVCAEKKLDAALLEKELEQASMEIHLPNNLNYDDWNVDFLTDYIINIHHGYLRKSLPLAKEYLAGFVEDHQEKYSFAIELQESFNTLVNEVLAHLTEEKEIVFPYIHQITHAYNSKESYAGLLIRTLRKPVQNMMEAEHVSIYKSLSRIRELTDQYTIPGNASVGHKVTFLKLKEIDTDLVQHLYLESSILFPKVLSMEKELLETAE